jgi:pilus assembly protein CpaD
MSDPMTLDPNHRTLPNPEDAAMISARTKVRGWSARRSAACIALATLALAACDRRLETTASFSQDYRQNHAIQLQRAPETLDVFIGRRAGGLDARQSEEVQEFAALYMKKGEGPLVAYLPAGGNPHEVNKALADIRRDLGRGGAAGRLQIATYHPDDPGRSMVIRLSFAALKAVTPHRCGNSSVHDAQGPASRYNRENSITFNFGCSYQQNLAAQIDDPRDLIRPRREDAVDTLKRASAIERLREGESASGANDLRPDGRGIDKTVGPQ